MVIERFWRGLVGFDEIEEVEFVGLRHSIKECNMNRK
jgi:hypothetical protein